jgi:hypothetical protein
MGLPIVRQRAPEAAAGPRALAGCAGAATRPLSCRGFLTAKRTLAWFLAVLALLASVASGGVALTDRLEARRTFCNACHLPDGTRLHASKMRLALERPGLDLTGVHFRKALEGHFTCADCHRGAGWQERAHVLWGSALNTARYAVGAFNEPDALGRPIVNRACTQCHADVTHEGDPRRFHGLKAHLEQGTVHCTACHLGHAAHDEPAAMAARARHSAANTCGRCHKGSPLADPVLAVLADYERALLQRMQR